MISSIQTNTSTYAANLNISSTSNVNHSEDAAKETAGAQIQSNMDTLTISEEGAAYVTQTAETAESNRTTDLISELTEDNEGEESSTSDLSNCSESELIEMLNNGEITQAEYHAELQSRAAAAGLTDEDA